MYFLIDKIYLCGITAKPPHREINKTALGATESVDWEYRSSCLELVQELRNNGVQVLSIEQAENKNKVNFDVLFLTSSSQ